MLPDIDPLYRFYKIINLLDVEFLKRYAIFLVLGNISKLRLKSSTPDWLKLIYTKLSLPVRLDTAIVHTFYVLERNVNGNKPVQKLGNTNIRPKRVISPNRYISLNV